MKMQNNNVTKFPKGFFASIKSCKTTSNNNPEDYDKPFEWSKNVLNGTSKVKLISVKIM